jgi:RecA/RadA recombinase
MQIVTINFSKDETTGGVPLCGITEVSGEAGSGKTQFCMMMSLQVVVGFFLSVAFINSYDMLRHN